MKRLVSVALLVLTPWVPVSAQAPASAREEAASLAVGDPCPPLNPEKFLKGDRISGFEKGKVYVVEFWATWCGPCIQAMPHLSELQAKYKDRGVTIIATNIREMRKDGVGWEEAFDETTLPKVEAFVKEQGDRMAYTVVYDGPAKKMDTAWMKASGSQGIPRVFLVDRKGTLAWIGHPMMLRMPLHEVAEGTWDNKTGPERVKQAEEAYLGAMRQFPIDAKAGLAAWDRAEKDYPILAPDLVAPKFDALLAAGHCDAAYAAGATLASQAIKQKNSRTLNSVAWAIVNPTVKLERRDLDLAFRAATKANEFTQGKDPGILDTLARVHFSKGEIDKAIECQTKAIELADAPMKLRLAPALEEYRKAKK